MAKKKKEVTKRPEGRPTKYDPKYCEMLIEHLKQGLSFELFSTEVGCCRRTLYDWLDMHPEFLHAKRIGTEWSQRFWEELGIKGIMGDLLSFNASTYIYTMKCRFGKEGWMNDQKTETTVKAEVSADVNTNPELKKYVDFLARAISPKLNKGS